MGWSHDSRAVDRGLGVRLSVLHPGDVDEVAVIGVGRRAARRSEPMPVAILLGVSGGTGLGDQVRCGLLVVSALPTSIPAMVEVAAADAVGRVGL